MPDPVAHTRRHVIPETVEQRLHAVTSSAPVIVYVIDRDGAILLSEGKGLDLINVAADELVGRSIYDLYGDTGVRETVQRALDGENVTLITEQETPVGRLHYEVNLSPLYDGGEQIVGAIGVANDVTERVWVEETLEQTIQRLTLLRRIDVELSESLELNSVLTIAMDTALRASRAEHGFIGLISGDQLHLVHAAGSYQAGTIWTSSSGVIGRALRTREAQLVLDADADSDYINDIPGTRAQMVIPLIHRDHLIGVLNLKTTHPQAFTPDAFDFLGLVAGHITVAIDNAELYRVSQQQLQELHHLYVRVSELEQLKTDMIRIAAHDLRNPLGVVKNYAELMLMEDSDPMTEEQHSFVEAIQGAGRKMLKIIDDILSLQRVEAAQENANCEDIDLNALVSDVFSGNQTRARQKDQQYSLTLPEATLMVCADMGQLREAMDNLINNAIKYTPPEGCITVRLDADVHQAIFEVEDNGLGIPDDQQGRLFQPFFRASNAKASKIEGTGLGLHLVKNIIERNHGRMHFQSTLSSGSVFGFELPLLD